MKVRVKPNSGKKEVKKEGDHYIVYLKSQPEKGKANLELLKVLKKHFKKDVRIKKGFTSKEKTIDLY
ncbi:MAG: DUF167 domain-containing protein [archaeon]